MKPKFAKRLAAQQINTYAARANPAQAAKAKAQTSEETALASILEDKVQELRQSMIGQSPMHFWIGDDLFKAIQDGRRSLFSSEPEKPKASEHEVRKMLEQQRAEKIFEAKKVLAGYRDGNYGSQVEFWRKLGLGAEHDLFRADISDKLLLALQKQPEHLVDLTADKSETVRFHNRRWNPYGFKDGFREAMNIEDQMHDCVVRSSDKYALLNEGICRMVEALKAAGLTLRYMDEISITTKPDDDTEFAFLSALRPYYSEDNGTTMRFSWVGAGDTDAMINGNAETSGHARLKQHIVQREYLASFRKRFPAGSRIYRDHQKEENGEKISWSLLLSKVEAGDEVVRKMLGPKALWWSFGIGSEEEANAAPDHPFLRDMDAREQN